MLPAQYRWLEAEPGPRMIVEALTEYGTLEAPGQPALRAAHAEMAIVTQAWSPLGGILVYVPGADESGGPLTDPIITDLAAKYGKTPAQVVLRRHIEHGFCAIPKSVKPHRIAENFDVFDFTLTADEVASIDALDTGVRGGPDPDSLNLAEHGWVIPD